MLSCLDRFRVISDLVCPCGSSDYIARMSIKTKPDFEDTIYELDILQCNSCGLFRTHPFVGSPNNRYEIQEVVPKIIENETIVNKDIFESLAKDILSSVEQYLQSGNLLDIGCGCGILLTMAKQKGWECYGVEVSQGLCDYLRSVGITVTNSTINNAYFPDEYFDVIVMNQVLEHIEDPNTALKEVKRILKNDGILIISVPNIDNVVAKVKGPAYLPLQPQCHIWHFSPKSLKRLLYDNGFFLLNERITTRNFRFNLLLSLLQNPKIYISRFKGAFSSLLLLYNWLNCLTRKYLGKMLANAVEILFKIFKNQNIFGDNIVLIVKK